MKRTLVHIHRSLWITIVVVLILLAVILTAARVTSPLLTNQRPTVERLLSTALSQPVHIGSLNLQWEKFMPVLKSSQVIIYDRAETHALLRVDEMEVELDVLESLLTGQLQLGQVTISGAKLAVRQMNDGSIVVNGIGAFTPGQFNSKENNLDALMGWLSMTPKLAFKNIVIDWYEPSGKLLPITPLNLHIKNHANRHSLWGEATLVEKIPTRVQFILKLNGNLQQLQTVKARFYFNGQNIQLAQWLKNHPIAGYTVEKGVANVQAWGAWEKQQLQNIHSLVTLQHTHVDKAGVKEPFTLTYGDANIFWKSQNKSWRLDAELNNLVFPRWEKIPGFTNLSTNFHLTPDAGFVELNSDKTHVDFGKLFHQPLALNKLHAIAHWQRTDQGWYFATDKTEIKAENASLTGSMSLLFPNGGSSPIVNALARFQVQGHKALNKCVPGGALSAGLTSWIQHSIKNIKLDATLALRGPLQNFPFDNNDGVFIADSHIEGLDLDYYPKWPSAKQLAGHLVFNNRSMSMDVTGGTVDNLPLKNLQLSIPRLAKDTLATLHIDGPINTDLSTILKFVHDSPLHESANSPQEIAGKGPLQMQIHLAIPVEHTKVRSTVDGKILLQNNDLTIHSLEFKKLSGEFAFTRDTVTAPRLTATLWNKPAIINITTVQDHPQIRMQYGDLQANLSPSQNTWLLHLDGANLNGDITIPNNKQDPIQANFSRLYISSDSSNNISNLKPTDLPRINLSADDVHYGSKQFRHVDLQLVPNANGVEISGLRATAPNLELAATGAWLLQNNMQSTQLAGEVTSNNVATALASLGLPSSIKSKQSRIGFNLAWGGPAYAPSLANMNGNLELKMSEGEIINIGREAAMKMDLGKLLYSLSLESLTRRLRLDFSDITTRGFPFDDVHGTFQLQNGNAYTRNTIINGPVANISMAGRIGLNTEDVDLNFNVTPKVASSLVSLTANPILLAAGVVTAPTGIGLGIAAGSWAASKLVGGLVNKIITYTYHMTGSWANPQIVQINWSKTAKNRQMSNQMPTSR